jgi:hypothetical protein
MSSAKRPRGLRLGRVGPIERWSLEHSSAANTVALIYEAHMHPPPEYCLASNRVRFLCVGVQFHIGSAGFEQMRGFP